MSAANIHASCVALGARGVLLLGKSGSGKSDLALRLIDGGARLVADDRTEIFAKNGLLCARAPKSIAGMMEVRGLGLVAMPFRAQAILALAVELGPPRERLPEPRFYAPPEGVGPTKPVPLIHIDPEKASCQARIRLALNAFVKGLIRNDIHPVSKNGN